jgi:hypothetical protein
VHFVWVAGLYLRLKELALCIMGKLSSHDIYVHTEIYYMICMIDGRKSIPNKSNLFLKRTFYLSIYFILENPKNFLYLEYWKWLFLISTWILNEFHSRNFLAGKWKLNWKLLGVWGNGILGTCEWREALTFFNEMLHLELFFGYIKNNWDIFRHEIFRGRTNLWRFFPICLSSKSEKSAVKLPSQLFRDLSICYYSVK